MRKRFYSIELSCSASTFCYLYNFVYFYVFVYILVYTIFGNCLMCYASPRLYLEFSSLDTCCCHSQLSLERAEHFQAKNFGCDIPGSQYSLWGWTIKVVKFLELTTIAIKFNGKNFEVKTSDFLGL